MTGEPVGTATAEARIDRPSAWAPFRIATFRMLWIVWATANVCLWMNDVAAAWMMTSLTSSPVLIAMVQTASSLPVFLLGIPSGALADILDRRRYFMATQFWVAANAAVVFAVSISGHITAPILLILVFTNGIGLAMRWPVFAAIIPEVVPRHHLQAALALNGVAMNASRVVGPLVAGAIIAAAGSEYVFALNFILSVAAGVALSLWKRDSAPSVLPGERFIGAMRLGWQYVRESRRMKDAIARSAAFFLHSTALIALLPLVAKRLGEGAATYTLLLSCMGVGAIVAAVQITKVRAHWTRDQLTVGGSVVQSIATAVIAVSPSTWISAIAMFVAGMAWILVANSVTLAAQLALPDWVRARGMSIYQMAIMGSSAGGALLWGKIADLSSVPASLGCAAASMLVLLVLTRKSTLEGAAEDDLTPTRPWQEPVPARPVDAHEGPVMVTIEYFIDPKRAAEFESVMAESRSARLRQGAVSWGMFEDVQQPGRFVEYFACDSWADYLRRFDRFTAADERLQAQRHAFHVGSEPPRIQRYVAWHPPARR
jgi:MFS family permease